MRFNTRETRGVCGLGAFEADSGSMFHQQQVASTPDRLVLFVHWRASSCRDVWLEGDDSFHSLSIHRVIQRTWHAGRRMNPEINTGRLSPAKTNKIKINQPSPGKVQINQPFILPAELD